MTEPARVSYGVTVSDGSYSNIRVQVDLPVEDGATPEEALARAREAVRARVRADFRELGDLRGWVDEEKSP